MIAKLVKWFKNTFGHPNVKIPKTEEEFKEIERRLDAGEDVSIPELAYLLRYLSEKRKTE